MTDANCTDVQNTDAVEIQDFIAHTPVKSEILFTCKVRYCGKIFSHPI